MTGLRARLHPSLFGALLAGMASLLLFQEVACAAGCAFRGGGGGGGMDASRRVDGSGEFFCREGGAGGWKLQRPNFRKR
ncbi:UNVERIFIED_CONTAM: hypothetical protein K2H54_019466 [Gekko kuhli]